MAEIVDVSALGLLVALRKFFGISQAQLARLLGVSQQPVAHAETGRPGPALAYDTQQAQLTLLPPAFEKKSPTIRIDGGAFNKSYRATEGHQNNLKPKP
jgi:DNA-binding XRE family transcriptional regulator